MGVVMRWNFEDGTTQGWTTATLDNTGQLEGTYSLYKSGKNIVLADISGVDFSTVTKPYLLFIAKTKVSVYNGGCHVDYLYVDTYDSTNTLIEEVPIYVYIYVSSNYSASTTKTYMYVAPLPNTAGQTNVTIKIRNTGGGGGVGGCTGTDTWIDNIQIYDEDYHDYTQVFAGYTSNNAITTTITPSTTTLPANITNYSFAMFGKLQGTDSTTVKFDVNTGTSIEWSVGKHLSNINSFATSPSTFDKVYVTAYRNTLDYTGGGEKDLYIVFMDGSYNVLLLYPFTLKSSPPPWSPWTVTFAVAGTFGTTVTKSTEQDFYVYGPVDITPVVTYLEGDNTLVQTGSTVTVEVWDSTYTTQYGSSTIDISTGTTITGTTMTGIPANTNLKIKTTASINASAPIRFRVDLNITGYYA